MRVLIISWHYPPLPSVASERIWCFARYLSEAGYEVDILTGETAVPEEDLPGVTVYRVASPLQRSIESRLGFLRAPAVSTYPRTLPAVDSGDTAAGSVPGGLLYKMARALNNFRIRRGLGYLGRMPDMTDLWYQPARRWIQAQAGWDIVISSYAPYSCLRLGRYAQRVGKCRLWAADFRDLWTRHHLFKGLFPFTLIERVMEKSILRHADLVSTVSAGLAEVLRRDHGHHNIHVVCNGFRPLEEIAPLPSPLPQTGRRIVLHTGTLYPTHQDVEALFVALAQLRERHPERAVQVLLAFAGGNVDVLLPLIQRHGCEDQVALLGLLSPDAARTAQQKAQALLYIGARRGAYRYGGIVPSKLFEYAASGPPVLFLGQSDASDARFLQQTGAGVIVNNTPAEICGALRDLADGILPGSVPRDECFIAGYSRRAQTQYLIQALRASMIKCAAPDERTKV